MVLLSLILLLPVSLVALKCQNFINQPVANLNIGSMNCLQPWCVTTVARIPVWSQENLHIGGCDLEKFCTEKGWVTDTKILSREVFQTFVRNMIILPANVTSVYLDGQCCKTDNCNR